MASFVRSASALLWALPVVLGAQQIRHVSGVLQRADAGAMHPVAGAWVVLHRVAHDKSGPLDSVRSDGRGRYAFRYTLSGDSAVYFASAMHAGVAYFTAPFTTADVSGTDAELTVFDTTSVGVRIATRSRHIVVFAADARGIRRVSEVFWLENGGARTRVPSAETPSWQWVLPAGAAGVRMDEGDVADQAIKVRDGRLEVFAPFSPGLRQLQISYQMPAARFPMTVPIADTIVVLEVLLEDPDGRARGANLVPQAAVSVSQRTFQRFLARDIPAGASFVISSARGAPMARGVHILVIVGLAAAALLVGLARLMATPAAIRIPGRPVPKRADELAHAIADLDQRFAKQKTPTADEHAAYAAERESLKAELTAVLAERDDQL